MSEMLGKLRALAGLFVFVIVFVGSSSVAAQTDPPSGDVKEEKPEVEAAAVTAPSVLVPAIKSLRDVSLGMTIDAVRGNLGKPDVEDKTGLLFTPTKTESVQIGLDPKGTVRTIALIYTEGDKNAPTFEQIFGPTVDRPETKEGIYKMVRYPDAGYWVSYSVTNPGDKATTVITMRRIED